MRRRTERYLLVAATVSAAVLLVAAASVAGISPLQSTSDATPSGAANVTAVPDDGNRSDPVVRHRDPDTIERSTVALDRTGLELARSLGVRLNVSASELREEDFTTAESQLGSDYQTDVIRLTEIAEATENTSDDEIAAAYREAGTEQRETIRNAEEFQELYTEYQQARASQNETRAREAARRLSAEFEEINASADELREAYGNLERVNESQAELAQRQINQSLDRASRITQTARTSSYTETTLTVTAVRPHGSPTRPFILCGELRSADGEQLANRTVVIGSEAHNTTVQTDRNGQFTLRHRPTVLKQGPQTVQVRYVPNATAGYLGETATTNVSVVQRASTVRLRTTPETVANGTMERALGRVLVDARGVEGVPVALRIGETQVATGRTNASGGFNLTASPPLSVPAGETDATVVVTTTDQAVARSQRTERITVGDIPTTLTLSAERTDSRTMRLTGTLRRESGEPLAGRTVTVSTGDRTLGWFRTDDNGRFAGNLTLVADQPGIDSADVAVTAAFDGASTHLSTARTTAAVTLPSFAPPGVFGYGVPARAWGLLAGAVALLGGAVVLTRRRTASDTAPAADPARAEVDSSAPRSAQSAPPDPLSMLESARAAVADAPRDATRLGYIAVRNELAGDMGLDDHASMTYWEFHAACREQADDRSAERFARFQELTELYEQAAYTDRPLSDERIDELLEYFAAAFDA
ncbi:DUF4129 domain-containing protein [Haloplanus halobius]|uniref:DUF4129 domain-containing protein n=1 Tax=Haloplanus halobius TaxID=2934938 RepID=UPI00200C1B45|nr:DUF4129 domain-containing protein [Haloplanus sp. XH21]